MAGLEDAALAAAENEFLGGDIDRLTLGTWRLDGPALGGRVHVALNENALFICTSVKA